MRILMTTMLCTCANPSGPLFLLVTTHNRWELSFPVECLHVSAFEIILCRRMIVDVLIAGKQTTRMVELRVACLYA